MRRAMTAAVMVVAASGGAWGQAAGQAGGAGGAPGATAPATQPAVPKGETIRFTFDASTIFPGTARDVWVYVPRQYDGSRPACLLVDQDAIQFGATGVMDTLIAAGEMPVTVGVFVQPGRVKAPNAESVDRANRSFEFDTLSDAYARFLLEELLPEVKRRKTADGRAIVISENPDDRAIMGSSSGAICAFTAAWERNDSFHRVFSSIGTYVGLRGGNVYPTLIRKYEPKAIRIFLQDGSNDNNKYGGDWWMANQEMERSLVYAGYEVNHVWGTGGHDSRQATEIFPEAMKWLWKDWPKAVAKGKGSEELQKVVVEGEGWRDAGNGTWGSADAQGVVTVGDEGGRLRRLEGSGPDAEAGAAAGAFGPQGRLYVAAKEGLTVIDGGERRVLSPAVRGRGVVARSDGSVFVAGTSAEGEGRVWLVKPDGTARVVDTGLKKPTGVTLSSDQWLLYVAEGESHWVYSYVVGADGTLAHKQKFYDLYVRDADDDAGAGGLCGDAEGRLYVATRAGVQVCDQAGRVNFILPMPAGTPAAAAAVTAVWFGGKDGLTLYAAAGGRVFARPVKVKGAVPFGPPAKPPQPRL